MRQSRPLLLGLLLAAAAILVWRAMLPDYGGFSDAQRHDKVLAMYHEYARNFPDVPDIPAKLALAAFNDASAIFIDVREPAERAVSTIPGALSTEEFLAAWKDSPGEFTGKTIIAYCTISYRSGVLADEWRRGNGPKVRNLEGGLLGWLHAGGPLATQNGAPIRTVHVFGAKWDLAPRDFETVH